MTAPSTLTPRILGEAENAHRALLGRFLAGTGLTYHHWVALAATAAEEAGTERGLLVERLTGGLKIDEATARETVAELATMGLVRSLPGGEDRIALTGTGQARHSEIRGAISEVISRIYGEVPHDELVTAGRVLSRITGRVNAELATA